MSYKQFKLFEVVGDDGYSKCGTVLISTSEEQARKDVMRRHPFMNIKTCTHKTAIWADEETLKEMIKGD